MNTIIEWIILTSKVIIFPGILTLILLAFLLEWFYRKLLARFQTRIGPQVAGPFGILQALADFIKTLSKEEIIPETAHKTIFKYLPFFAPLPVMIGLFMIPIASEKGFVNSPGDIYLLIFILSLFAAIQITLGWASGSRYALIGAARSGLQLVSFGIPLVFSVIVPVMYGKSFDLSKIVEVQAVKHGYLPNWVVFHIVGLLAFIIFLICGLAELEKVPFDTPEAETEIAGGWTLEYSGRRFAFILLSQELKEILIVGLAVTLFLGGPTGPTFGATGILKTLLFTVYFVIKCFFVMFLLALFSASMARLKVSQILEGTWSYLAPVSVLTIVLLIIIG